MTHFIPSPFAIFLSLRPQPFPQTVTMDCVLDFFYGIFDKWEALQEGHGEKTIRIELGWGGLDQGACVLPSFSFELFNFVFLSMHSFSVYISYPFC
jgi:hypothetical protein